MNLKEILKYGKEELIKNNETYKQIALSQLSEEELNLQKNQEIEGGNKHE